MENEFAVEEDKVSAALEVFGEGSANEMQTSDSIAPVDFIKEADIIPSEHDEEIKRLLDEFVRPAVEQDGGAIDFVAFKDGTVYVHLRGACSGCPSSTQTLKGGIEQLLKSKLNSRRRRSVGVSGYYGKPLCCSRTIGAYYFN